MIETYYSRKYNLYCSVKPLLEKSWSRLRENDVQNNYFNLKSIEAVNIKILRCLGRNIYIYMNSYFQ